MSDKEFTFTEATDSTRATESPAAAAPQGVPCAHACPLAQIPADVWKAVLRPPFRKRHPFLYWMAVVLVLVGVGTLPLLFDDDSVMSQPRMGLVTVTGPIMDVTSHLRWIRTLSQDDNVKGVLLRVDSPGGGAAASQELYGALRELAQKKPVAVTMGSVAASGGLMISMAGQRIFANASTVTGSIGVRMDIPQVQGLFAKLGVGQETVTTARYKDAGSYLRPLTPEQRAYFQTVLDDMHRQFVEIIAAGRHMEATRAAALANGKIFTGREAVQLGLVDEVGGQEAALRWLAKTCGVPAERKLQMPPQEDGWLPRRLKSLLGLDVTALGHLAFDTSSSAPQFLYQF